MPAPSERDVKRSLQATVNELTRIIERCDEALNLGSSTLDTARSPLAEREIKTARFARFKERAKQARLQLQDALQ